MGKKKLPVASMCDICLSITSAESYREVMKKIVQRATELFDLKGALIRILDKRAQTLEIAAHYGLSEEYVQKGPIYLAESKIDQETIAGNTVIIKNAQKDKRIPGKSKERKNRLDNQCPAADAHEQPGPYTLLYDGNA